MTALWPLLWTWTRLSVLRQEQDRPIESWRAALSVLGMQGDELQSRVDALDAYLDNIEEAIEEWGRRSGMIS